MLIVGVVLGYQEKLDDIFTLVVAYKDRLLIIFCNASDFRIDCALLHYVLEGTELVVCYQSRRV